MVMYGFARYKSIGKFIQRQLKWGEGRDLVNIPFETMCGNIQDFLTEYDLYNRTFLGENDYDKDPENLSTELTNYF